MSAPEQFLYQSGLLFARQGEDDPDTSTASDDSGNGPWTVVTSPTHKRTDSVEANSRPSPVPEDPLEDETVENKPVKV